MFLLGFFFHNQIWSDLIRILEISDPEADPAGVYIFLFAPPPLVAKIWTNNMFGKNMIDRGWKK